MPQLLHRYATPLVTGLFLVSLISGVALYFHVGQSAFHEMHEVLSMVLILPFALHLWRNWRSFAGYFRRAPMALVLVASTALALGYAAPALTSGQAAGSGRAGPPQFAFAEAMLHGSPVEIAPLLDTSADAVAARLEGAGIAVSDPARPLDELAADAGKTDADVIRALMTGN